MNYLKKKEKEKYQQITGGFFMLCVIGPLAAMLHTDVLALNLIDLICF